MNFINRAIKNVTRKISKSILLILTFFLIGNLVIIGLGVSTASKSAKTLTRQKMRAVVTYTVDYDSISKYVNSLEDEDEINKFYQNYPSVKLSDVEALLTDDRVKTANALQTSMYYQVDGVEYVKLGNQAEQSEEESNYTSCYLDANGNEICDNVESEKFFVKGNYFPDMIEFSDGDYKIVSGRFYNQDEIDNNSNVVLISEALAEVNGVSVGDTIKFGIANKFYYLRDGTGITEDDLIVEYEIIGIYSHNQAITPDSNNFDYTYPYENPDNMILMPGTTLNNASVNLQQKMFDYYKETNPDDEYYQNEANRPSVQNKDSITVYDTTILLNDPLEVDDFVEEYSSKLTQFHKLDANNEEFEKLSKPLDTLSLYANFIVWLVVINAIVIITLVTALTLKTREYEIGVLLSIGATKFKVIMQFFVELAIVAVIGFTLAVGSGSLIANKVGAKVLEYQISSSGIEEDDSDDNYYYSSIWDSDYTTDISLDDLLSEYEVTVSPMIIAEIYVMGLAIVMISVIIPSFMIMRYNPKKILMNQG